jgi:hypothetical protein
VGISIGYILHEKNSLELIQAMLYVLCGNAELSLEGDLSQVTDILDMFPATSEKPTDMLPRQTHWPQLDFVVIPLEWETINMIEQDLLPSVGLGTSIRHVQIAKDKQWQFGAYNLDHWGPGMHAIYVAGDAVNESTLAEMISRRLLRGYERRD